MVTGRNNRVDSDLVREDAEEEDQEDEENEEKDEEYAVPAEVPAPAPAEVVSARGPPSAKLSIPAESAEPA